MPEVHHLGCFEWSRHKGQAMEAGSACAKWTYQSIYAAWQDHQHSLALGRWH